MKVPLSDPLRIPLELNERIRSAIDDVLLRGHYVLGPKVIEFEESFAKFIGVNHCISVANGTDALELALRSLEVGPGDEVITQANAGGYATTAINLVGAIPRFIDIKSSDLSFDESLLNLALTKNTKAIIVCHLYGRMARIDNICEIAAQREIPIIEDCAQCHGASLCGISAGAWGKLACFSFYPTKNLGGIGDGGAIVTSNEELAHKLAKLRQYGWSDKYNSELFGGRNSRLDEIHAAVLIEKLKYLPSLNEERRRISEFYLQETYDLPIIRPDPGSSLENVFHLFVIRVEDRTNIRAKLAEHGIQTAIHYPIPDHHQSSFQSKYAAVSLPITELEAQRILSLPCFPGLSAEEQIQVITALKKTLKP